MKPLTAASKGSRRHAEALYGVNAGAERTPGAVHVPQRLAVLPARRNSPGKSWARRGGHELVPPPHVRLFDRERVHGLAKSRVDSDDERVSNLLGEGLEGDSIILQVPPQPTLDGHQTLAQFADRMPAHNRGVAHVVVDYRHKRTDERAEV